MSSHDVLRSGGRLGVVAGSSKATVFHMQRPRQPKEKYYTPAWATEALLRRVRLGPTLWEPAAGDGGMAKVLAASHVVYASDIEPEHASIVPLDFLSRRLVVEFTVFDVVTNPPFGHGGMLAVKFIQRALALTKAHGGMVAMLLRDDFDSAGGRAHLFRDCPAWDTKVVLLERIRWDNLPQVEAGPSGSHAWFVWDWSRILGEPARLLYEGRHYG